MKSIYLVRHGQTEWNAIRRMQGQWNSDLNDRGRGQAETNGQLLKKLPIEAMYVSPLDRTRQTAEIINQHLQLEPVFDDRIMEWHCGDWSGELYADIETKWPEGWAARSMDQFHYRPPNGENYPDMFQRSEPFLNEVLASAHEHIVIVSHGMIGKVMLAQLMDYPPAQTLAIHQPNDTVFKVIVKASGNEVFYFEQGRGPIPGLPDFS